MSREYRRAMGFNHADDDSEEETKVSAPLADRVADLRGWAQSRILECQRQELKFGNAWQIREKSPHGPPQALVEAWSERRALEAALCMLDGKENADSRYGGAQARRWGVSDREKTHAHAPPCRICECRAAAICDGCYTSKKLGTPKKPRTPKKPGMTIYKPRCIDCSETDRANFYSHPTNRTGCQSRCKSCDNQKRMGNYQRGSGGGVEAMRNPDGSITLVRQVTPRRGGAM